MTRKRFVKLLMGVGYSRNRAAAIAELCRQRREPYAAYLNRARLHVFYNAKKFKRSLKAAARAMQNLARKVRESLGGLVVHHPHLITTTNAYNFLEKNMQVVPLADHKKMHDGLRVNFSAIDEMDTYTPPWPKDNPYIKAGGAE